MRNLLASALVALLVSIAASPAEPLPIQRPSSQDRINALITRVDKLQNQQAHFKADLKAASQNAFDALALAGCITGARVITNDPDTGDITYADDADPTLQVDYFATIDPDCLA